MKKRYIFPVLVLLAAALLWLRPWAEGVRLPAGQSITLSICDGEQVTWRLLYTTEDMKALNQAIREAKTAKAEDWTPPQEPWPVYGLTVHGTTSDFQAAYCGGVWVDNEGRALEMELDFAALWDSFSQKTSTHGGLATLPCRRELALWKGQWNPTFLTEQEGEPSPNLTMSFVDGDPLTWEITNVGDAAMEHGNGGGAGLEVLLDGRWYGVPVQSGGHYGVTAEGYALEPGESYSCKFSFEPYGDLPDGAYRVAFQCTSSNPSWEGPRVDDPAYMIHLAVVPFFMEDGRPNTP